MNRMGIIAISAEKPILPSGSITCVKCMNEFREKHLILCT